MTNRIRSRDGKHDGKDEQGFMLVGLVVAIFLILLALSVAAPRVARELRREREVEAVHRGDQYVRAIQLYYRKTHTYPGSIEQLEKSNNVRFLRQKYIDPMTGKSDWRLIHVGEAKTTVKGFFGQPLAGIGGGAGSLGSVSDMVSSSGTGTPVGSSPSAFGSPGASGSTFGSPGASGSAFGSGGLGSIGPASAAAAPGTPGAPGSSGAAGSAFGSSSGIGSQSATSFSGGGAPFVGVGSAAKGDSIIVLNEQTTYPTWEFIYDPRIEQLKAKASLFGGGPPSTDATTGMSSGFGGAPAGSGAGGSSFGGTTNGAGSGTSPASGTEPGTPSGSPASRF